ncbi:rhomboid family intramembrane serine protease [Shinella zoogloeoides]|uniref:rhomboid family intramembrane serine protease n=1 Tax=Shinella zoogloeoides TaxID=352475 RepID=UPI0028A5A036|nr:rhomboid family intramembrane serine protease [Shinella zoogloeoides]
MSNDGVEVQQGDGFETRKREPAFNLPGSLVFVLGLLTLVHLVRTYVLSPSADEYVLLEFAFIPGRYAVPFSEWDLSWLWSPVTYSLLHGGWEHLIFNAFWMVAFGAPVVRRIGTVRFFLFWCLSAIAAVAFHTALHWGAMILVVGASGVVSGLMGAAARFVFSPSGRVSRQFAHLNRRLTIPEALSNRSVLVFSGIWFLTNFLIGFGQIFGSVAAGGAVAWEAHIGGFLFGFLFFPIFDVAAVESRRD